MTSTTESKMYFAFFGVLKDFRSTPPTTISTTMTTTEVKLLTLLNVSAIKRPRDLDLPGGFRSPSASRAQSVDNDEVQKKRPRRSVMWGGEMGPSGSTFGKKGKGKEKEKKVVVEVNGDVEVEEAEVDESDDDVETAASDSFNSHFGAETPLLSTSIVAAAQGEWNTSRESVKGLGRVVETRPAGVSKAEDKARVS